ncbi:MAG: AEC family transporter [Myxococcota bacterium]|nr:AEC family transporter [Myxococcota bacterium]
MELWLAALALGAPIALGGLAGAVRLFPDPDGAVDHLNRYALYFAFPALVFRGLVDAAFTLPGELGFWLLVPLVLAVSAALVRLLFPREAPTLALIVAFGNVAYLGLPVVEKVLGESAVGLAGVAVAIHVTLALSVGPLLLLRWSGRGDGLASSLGRVVRQPLLWAPLAGLLARNLPDDARALVDTVVAPLGRSAAPVALFLLGLYLFTHRARLRKVEGPDVTHLAVKLLLLPALTFAGAWAFHAAGMMTPAQAQVLGLLSAMPAAITTFAIAQQLDVGAARTSRAIVATTVLSIVTIPLTSWLALTWVAGW